LRAVTAAIGLPGAVGVPAASVLARGLFSAQVVRAFAKSASAARRAVA
jgi:hypothetical protein